MRPKYEMPPFLKGQKAFKERQGLKDNPHDMDEIVPLDDWPGAYRNWEAGWKFAYRLTAHTNRSKREKQDAR